MISAVSSICSGPILNQGKCGRNQGHTKESDFVDFAGTLGYPVYSALYKVLLLESLFIESCL